jgi:hypothetical protein
MMARPGDLRQVFLNLVLNAVDVLPMGGKLRIRVCSQSGIRVCVTVADNGPGIPENSRTRIFEPFFSTKDVTGTGLRLWVLSHDRGEVWRTDSDADPMRRVSQYRHDLPGSITLRICGPCTITAPRAEESHWRGDEYEYFI